MTEDVLLKGFPLPELKSAHQWQRNGTESSPNDCTVASMAMASSLLLEKAGFVKIPFGDLAREMDREWWNFYRIPAWMNDAITGFASILNKVFGEDKIDFSGFQPGGATWVSGAVRKLKSLGMNYGEGRAPLWRVAKLTGRSTDTLLKYIQKGCPTLIYGVQPNGIPHVVVVVGHGREEGKDKWVVLDPAVTESSSEWDEEDKLLPFWSAYALGCLKIYRKGTMITLEPTTQG